MTGCPVRETKQFLWPPTGSFRVTFLSEDPSDRERSETLTDLNI